MPTSKGFAVFDGDSHVLEPRDIWEKYLDPEFRTLGKFALWREESEFGSYTVVNGKPVRDLTNNNVPRHAIWRPGMTWNCQTAAFLPLPLQVAPIIRAPSPATRCSPLR